MKSHYSLSRADYEEEVDMTLAGSFPASDPPSWTLGVSGSHSFEGVDVPRPVAAQVDVIVAGGSRDRRRFSAMAEVFGMAALIPFGILLAALPIVALQWVVWTAMSWIAR